MDEINQRKYRHLWKLAVLVLAGMGAWLYLASRVEYPQLVRIGDGSPVGRYAALNQDLQRRLTPVLKEEFGIALEAVHTEGSLENLRRVEEGGLHLAFYQEGVGHSEQVRSVANLEYEYVFVVVPDGSAKESLADLSDERLNLGPPGSGTYILASQILDYFPLRTYQEKNYSFAEVEERFAEELDAAFFVAGLQAPALTQFLQTGSYRILPLEFAPAMSSAYSWVDARPIPASTFARIPRAVPAENLPTLAVKSALIAGSGVPGPLVDTVLRTILETPFAQENNLTLLSATRADRLCLHQPAVPPAPGGPVLLFPLEAKDPLRLCRVLERHNRPAGPAGLWGVHGRGPDPPAPQRGAAETGDGQEERFGRVRPPVRRDMPTGTAGDHPGRIEWSATAAQYDKPAGFERLSGGEVSQFRRFHRFYGPGQLRPGPDRGENPGGGEEQLNPTSKKTRPNFEAFTRSNCSVFIRVS